MTALKLKLTLLLASFCFKLFSLHAQVVSLPTNSASAILYAAQQAYGDKKYSLAEYYADKALLDSSTAAMAAEVKIQSMAHTACNATDSTRYLLALLELHDMQPRNRVYMSLLMEYFTSPGHTKEMQQFANDEIRKDSTNSLAWALKGETLMKEAQWERAMKCYEKTLKLDSTFVEATYNLALCYIAKAKALQDSLTDNGRRMSRQEAIAVKKLYRMAVDPLLHVSRLASNDDSLAWRATLTHLYRVLGEKKKIQELQERQIVK